MSELAWTLRVQLEDGVDFDLFPESDVFSSSNSGGALGPSASPLYGFFRCNFNQCVNQTSVAVIPPFLEAQSEGPRWNEALEWQFDENTLRQLKRAGTAIKMVLYTSEDPSILPSSDNDDQSSEHSTIPLNTSEFSQWMRRHRVIETGYLILHLRDALSHGKPASSSTTSPSHSSSSNPALPPPKPRVKSELHKLRNVRVAKHGIYPRVRLAFWCALCAVWTPSPPPVSDESLTHKGGATAYSSSSVSSRTVIGGNGVRADHSDQKTDGLFEGRNLVREWSESVVNSPGMMRTKRKQRDINDSDERDSHEMELSISKKKRMNQKKTKKQTDRYWQCKIERCEIEQKMDEETGIPKLMRVSVKCGNDEYRMDSSELSDESSIFEFEHNEVFIEWSLQRFEQKSDGSGNCEWNTVGGQWLNMIECIKHIQHRKQPFVLIFYENARDGCLLGRLHLSVMWMDMDDDQSKTIISSDRDRELVENDEEFNEDISLSPLHNPHRSPLKSFDPKRRMLLHLEEQDSDSEHSYRISIDLRSVRDVDKYYDLQCRVSHHFFADQTKHSAKIKNYRTHPLLSINKCEERSFANGFTAITLQCSPVQLFGELSEKERSRLLTVEAVHIDRTRPDCVIGYCVIDLSDLLYANNQLGHSKRKTETSSKNGVLSFVDDYYPITQVSEESKDGRKVVNTAVVGYIRICVTLEDLGHVGSQTVQTDSSITSNNSVTTLPMKSLFKPMMDDSSAKKSRMDGSIHRHQSANESGANMNPREMIQKVKEMQRDVANELEEWKQREQKKWVTKMRKMEQSRMQELEEDWKRQIERKTEQLRIKKSDMLKLEKKMRNNLGELERHELRLKDMETRMTKKKSEMESELKLKQNEVTHLLKRVKRENSMEVERLNRMMERMKHENEAMAVKLEEERRQSEKHKRELGVFRREMEQSTEGVLKLEIESLKNEVNAKDKECLFLQSANSELKSQLKNSLKEISRLERKQKQMELEHLKKERSKLEQMKLELIAKNTRHSKADRNKLEEFRTALEQTKRSS